MRTPGIIEQLSHARQLPPWDRPFSSIVLDIRKKKSELSEQLHVLKFSPARASQHAVNEANLVLMQAEQLLTALPSDSASAPKDEANKRFCRAVDTVLMLDAAIRALKSP